MFVGVHNPGLVGYEPKVTKDELQQAYEKRWVNMVNTGGPWSFIKEKVFDTYNQSSLGFSKFDWIIGEYHFQGDQTQQQWQDDLKAMLAEAKTESPLLGCIGFQFQMVPPALEGMFNLGDTIIGETDKVCTEDVNVHTQLCDQWHVHCLDGTSKGATAKVVAEAWGGSIVGHGQCMNSSKSAELRGATYVI